MRKNSLFLLCASCLIMFSAFSACKGKKGDNGPLGPGSTQTIYTGIVPPETDIVLHNSEFDISAPVLTENSNVQVYLSSNTLDWHDYGFDYLSVDAKKIHMTVGNSFVDHVGWSYKAFVRNS